MTVRFQDLQDADNPRNGKIILLTEDLSALLDELNLSRPPFMCELADDNGSTLTVGVGGTIGCVQHGRSDGTVPYLMATENKPQTIVEQDAEFLVGGTLTPIEGKYCLPFDRVKEVIVEFASGSISKKVNWEEI